jgi:hypothetical protein
MKRMHNRVIRHSARQGASDSAPRPIQKDGMTIKRVLAAFALLLAFSSAHASMIWTAVALSTKQLDAIAKDEGLLEKTLENSTGKQSMDLDKAWHGIHFLLNGTAWSITTVAGEAILGGREFGPDMGYGRPKLISADKVKQIATALANVTATELSSRYHPEAMEKALKRSLIS